MAEETKPAAVSVPEEVVVSDVPTTTDTTVAKKETDAPAPPAPEPEQTDKSAEEPVATTEEVDQEKKISQSNSFKEETNVVSDLPESQRKALDDLKKLIQEALNKHEFTDPPPAPVKEESGEEKKPEEEAEVTAATEEKTPAVGTEEKKDDVPEAAATSEQPQKTEETPVEKTEDTTTTTAPAEEPKLEEEKNLVVPESEPIVVEKTTTTTDDDGAKTVEAIEESVVSSVTTTTTPPPTETEKNDSTTAECTTDTPPPPPQPEEIPILYGIPLLNSDYSDVILLKFLRARDFKLQPTLSMIKKCVRWRKEFGVDTLLDEDLGNDYEKVVFAHGHDKQGRLVVYNVFGEFKDKELYQLAFSDAEKQKKLLKWLVQFVERIVRKFDFSPTGINSFVVVNDLCNSPGYGKREFYKIINKYGALLQDNYPEFVSKQVCINVSFWYLAYSWVYVNVFTPRSKSKFVFSSSSKTPETLFRYIAPEQVPVQYGGHSRTGELEFTTEEAVTEVTIKPSSTYPLEFAFNEVPCTFVWELRVVGWEVNYEAQFIPTEGYTVLVSKAKKMTVGDEPIICDSFKVTEPGKLVITIDNHGSSKKKKLLYRSKIKSSSEQTATA